MTVVKWRGYCHDRCELESAAVVINEVEESLCQL